MREVQVTCPQCGRDDAYLEPELQDYTAMIFIPSKWKCRNCGYPDFIWDTKERWNYPEESHIVIKIVDS